ncbi:MetQ/NlpA family ABC transporter substrate-binding protein [Aquisphaera insulae]|uniref:MetQ/NlpA family ABC transporter substrate-binding protein n=1 Tax=Aquisphaera insulae TaxID=2712864 RepID=UPI0013ED969A|nr:MetQ/NlpA family ABC transporter substrate-binding protein [Aquisphaera insulae]
MKPRSLSAVGTWLIPVAAFVVFSGCNAATDTKSITFGATAGDFSDIVSQSLKPQLEAKGYRVQLVQFSDYVQPNIALAERRLDANIFQHKPYLDEFVAQKGLKLTPVAQVPTAPLGLYAGKRKTLAEATDGIRVAVPNDPTNLARALRILADLGWIALPEGADPFHISPKDITSNPKHVEIVQLEAAQLPRSAQDVDYAIINGNYVVTSGMKLSAALAREKGKEHVNWAVVRTEDVGKPFVADIVAALKSPSFKEYADRKFAGYNFPENWGE